MRIHLDSHNFFEENLCENGFLDPGDPILLTTPLYHLGGVSRVQQTYQCAYWAWVAFRLAHAFHFEYAMLERLAHFV